MIYNNHYNTNERKCVMKLYHGTISSGAENIIKNGIKISKGKPKVDFGQGFYTTPSFAFAQSTAINKAKKTNMFGGAYVTPCILTYEFDNIRAREDCKILSFNDIDIKWAQFIINNRNGFEYMKAIGSNFHNIKHNYDIVQGAIADNKIVLLAETLGRLNKKIDPLEINDIIYYYLTKQISFHTIKSLSYIKLTSYDIIKEKKGDVVNG